MVEDRRRGLRTLENELEFTQLPQGIKLFMVPAYLRQATKVALTTKEDSVREGVIGLLVSQVDVMSDIALEEAKSIGAGTDAQYPQIITNIGIERLQFLYSVLISHAIRSASLEGLILLSGRVRNLLPINSDNPEEVYAMYGRICITANLLHEAALMTRNQKEYKRAVKFNGIEYPYIINDVPNKLSSLFVYMAKENIERAILSGKGVSLPTDSVKYWLDNSKYKVEV